MKFLKNIAKIIFPTLIIIVFSISMPFGSAAEPEYPVSINGLPVIFIKTSENTAGLNDEEITVVLFDSSSSSMEESSHKLNFGEYLANHPLPKGWSIEIYGGKGASIEEFEKVHKKNNDYFANHGPFVLTAPLSLRQESAKPLTVDLVGYPTFAIVKNTDPSSQNITAHIAQWYPPTVGDYQNVFSGFLINGLTNEDFFLQSGNLFVDGEGFNVWTDDDEGREPQYFDVGYYTNHYYSFGIIYVGGGGDGWQMGCQDWVGDVYDYHINWNAPGTKLKTENATGVFFENWNTNANWYQGFSGSVSAFNAEDYNGQWKDWDNDAIVITDSSMQEVPNNGIIEGNLADGYGATWYLDEILIVE